MSNLFKFSLNNWGSEERLICIYKVDRYVNSIAAMDDEDTTKGYNTCLSEICWF